MPDPEPITLTLAHSPDPDDAFMWWPLGVGDEPPAFDLGPFRFRAVAQDIEALNRRAIEQGDLDITAMSVHAYPHASDRYALTSCGGSFGSGYGPKLVAAQPIEPQTLDDPGRTVAIPGVRTTAYLTLRLMLGERFGVLELPFQDVIPAVADGRADAGLVIHEAQLTFQDAGLHLVRDLGAWWQDQTALPLPLGANAIRRDLEDRCGPGTLARVTSLLERSIRHAMAHRQQGLAYASGFTASGIDPDDERIDRFVGMYVDDLTLDAGERGREAIQRLLALAAERGLCPPPGPVDLVRPA